MASSYTTNYNLNQWEASDKVLRTEFNADNAKIDAAIKAVDGRVDGLSGSKASQTALNTLSGQVDTLSATVSAQGNTLEKKGNCQIQVMTYSGDGASTRTHTFSQKPTMLIILSDMQLILLQGCGEAIHTLGGGNTHRVNAAWSGCSVTLSTTNSTTSDLARVIANSKNQTYYVLAFYDQSA